MLLDDVYGFTRGHRGRERTEVAAAIFDDLAGGENTRPYVPGGNLDAQIALVVLETNVVTRFVLLDQIVFKNQSFLVIAGDQSLEISDPPE